MVSEPQCDIVADILTHFEHIQDDLDKGEDSNEDVKSHLVFNFHISGASAISLLTSCVCLVLALLLNIYIAVNIIYRRKFQVCHQYYILHSSHNLEK